MSTPCFLGLGSNVDPERNLAEAARLLRTTFPDITFSSVYQSAAQYHEDQPAFLNAVAKVETEKNPEEILRDLRSIEKKLHKSLPFRFGPRTIDLDLLMHDNLILPSPEEWHAANQLLILPHPRLHERRFVLEPLCELIDKNALHPVFRESWGSLLRKTLGQSCDRTTLSL